MLLPPRLSPLASRQIARWGLTDTMFVEVQLRLRGLCENHSEKLVRVREPFDGLCYSFDMIDPEDHLRQRFFVFQVVFSMDEERLIIVRGTYHRFDA